MELPTTGLVRLRFINGTTSKWQPAQDIELGYPNPVILCRGDEKNKMCVAMFPLTSIFGVEYASETEVEAMEKAAKEKSKKKPVED